MTERCPHCGEDLGSFRDAFCPECRQSLDEPLVYGTLPMASTLPASAPPPLAVSEIVGAEGLSAEDVAGEIARGGQLVIYKYCVSVIWLSILQPTRIHLVGADESAVTKGLSYTLLSLLAGWWGFPFGFIYTPAAIFTNLGGGIDVTDDFSLTQAETPESHRTKPSRRPGSTAITRSDPNQDTP